MQIKVIVRNYNSMRGCNTDHSKWTTGVIYNVILGDRNIKVGFYNSDPPTLANAKELEHMSKNAYPEKTEILFKEMTDICQENLIGILGDEFPWTESMWENHQEYLKWSKPQTLEGMINKSLHDRIYFYNTFYLSPIWINCIEEMHTIFQCPNIWEGSGEDIVKLDGNWYIVEYGMSSEHGYWAKLIACSEDEAIKKLTVLNTKNKANEAKRIVSEEKAAANRLAYAKRCGRISRKYQIRFEIVLALGDNDKKVKKFVLKLKNAIKQGCIFDALHSYNEDERGDELERLGFDRYLSRKVSAYIADCVISGSILM